MPVKSNASIKSTVTSLQWSSAVVENDPSIKPTLRNLRRSSAVVLSNSLRQFCSRKLAVQPCDFSLSYFSGKRAAKLYVSERLLCSTSLGNFAAKLYVSERLVYCTSLGNWQQSCTSLTTHLLYISGKLAAKLYISERLICCTSLGNLQQSCTYLSNSSSRK